VILELVGAPHFPGNLKALALKGRIAVIGTGAGAEATLPLLGLMVKRGAVYGSVLRARSLEDKALAIRAFEREVVPQLDSGRIRPVVDSVFPAEEVTAAFDRMDGPGKLGRVLIEFA
jgi:NADPH:quinone reductase-like Zn-dependent oxidoreductase